MVIIEPVLQRFIPVSRFTCWSIKKTHCPKILVLCEIELKVLHKFKKETKTVKVGLTYRNVKYRKYR